MLSCLGFILASVGCTPYGNNGSSGNLNLGFFSLSPSAALSHSVCVPRFGRGHLRVDLVLESQTNMKREQVFCCWFLPHLLNTLIPGNQYGIAALLLISQSLEGLGFLLTFCPPFIGLVWLNGWVECLFHILFCVDLLVDIAKGEIKDFRKASLKTTWLAWLPSPCRLWIILLCAIAHSPFLMPYDLQNFL